jgi:hypothetical protein
MNRATVLWAAILAATGFSLRAQDPQEQIKMLRKQVDVLSDQLVEERAKLLLDLKVNGQRLDPKDVMREAVYLTGGKLVEAKVADFFILEELKKQTGQGGKDPKAFMVTDEDVMTELAPMKADFETKNPGVDFWEVVRSQYGLNKETFLEQRKQAILFDRVFFPGTPKDWPDITKEAIKAQTQSDQGPKFIEQLEKATEGVDEKGNPKKLPDFWVNMMRQFVQKGLRNWSDIRYASNGLPSNIVLKVNDLEWSTDDAFTFVKKGMFVQDLERAMQEVVVREALRQELVGKDAYVSDEEFQRRYEEYRQPYDTTPFTVEVIATRFKGYPCLEAFRSRWRLITSYGDMIKDEINDEPAGPRRQVRRVLRGWPGQHRHDPVPGPQPEDGCVGAGRHGQGEGPLRGGVRGAGRQEDDLRRSPERARRVLRERREAWSPRLPAAEPAEAAAARE